MQFMKNYLEFARLSTNVKIIHIITTTLKKYTFLWNPEKRIIKIIR